MPVFIRYSIARTIHYHATFHLTRWPPPFFTLIWHHILTVRHAIDLTFVNFGLLQFGLRIYLLPVSIKPFRNDFPSL